MNMIALLISVVNNFYAYFFLFLVHPNFFGIQLSVFRTTETGTRLSENMFADREL